MKTRKPARTKKRAINKSMDSRFTLRNQRAALDGSKEGKGLADIQDIPRQRKAAKGPGRVQLGRTLNQGELADKDPVRED